MTGGSAGAPALRESTRHRVDAAVRTAQRDWRAPSLSAGLIRDGQVVHTVHVGSACLDPPRPADDTTGFLMGSVTKTFTGVLVLALRDEGRLRLDDPVSAHLPDLAARPAGLTIRLLLAHLSGLQREPAGRVWESLRAPDAADLLAGLAEAEHVIDPYHAFHYSNLAFALLGQVVERIEGRSWEQVVADRVLGPLGLTGTGLTPPPGRATGYFVQPFSGVATAEPVVGLGATAPMGGLWTTTTDLLRYAAFLADPDPAVLAPATLEQMTRPVVFVDPDGWTMAYGLSLGLIRRGERIYVGHGGAMPGFLTGLRVSRPDRLGAVVWANTTAGAAPIALAADLLDLVLEAEPTPARPWHPEQPRPEWDELLGSWWVEGEQVRFSVREGRLWCQVVGEPAVHDSRFEQVGPDLFRVDRGRELGERLEVARHPDGTVDRLYLATYPVTRQPLAFGELSSATDPA